MTVKELQALRDKIDTNIRAAIRAKREGKMAGPPMLNHEREEMTPSSKMDLERERDAWLSSRRSG